MILAIKIIVIILVLSILAFVILLCLGKKRHKKFNYFGDTLSRTGHPLIRLFHNGRPYLLLVDTGSTHNIIDSRIVNELDSRFVRKGKVLVSGINSNSEETLETYRIRFDDHSNSFTDDFLVLDLSDTFSDIEDEMEDTIAGILGVGFLSKYALTLDFKQNTIN